MLMIMIYLLIFQFQSIYTNDGSGNLTIDNNGKVHAFWGEMYVTDVTPGDGTSSYYQ